ncbi:MAG: ABC transporter permease subunit, partial [Chloroflexota bacterium]
MATAPLSSSSSPTVRQRDKRGIIAAVIALIALMAFATLVQTKANGYQQQIIVLVFIYSIVAVALAVTSGFTGVFSLGQIGFLAIGAYVSAVIDIPPMWKDEITLADLPPWLAKLDMSTMPPQVALLISCLVAGLVAALVGLIVGAPLMRLSGHYVAVATMGFLIIVYTIV